MKRFFLAAFFFFAPFVVSFSQECSTTWPYVYPEFREAVIYMNAGQKILQEVNVHMLKSRLHFVDKGVIKEMVPSDIVAVEIGGDKYVPVGSDIMLVVKSCPDGFVAAHRVGEFDKLQDPSGAYGSSSTTAATMSLTSVEVSGKVNQNHMELWQNRQNGAEVGVRTTYYIVAGGKAVKASRKDIEDTLDPARKAQFKDWLKANKIQWKNPESLLKLVEFLK